ncbi:AMP-binding enzyme [Colletotrichum tofieldiae]|nr:AMP-binding enzyme [Colletotrichum tofieldiae]
MAAIQQEPNTTVRSDAGGVTVESRNALHMEAAQHFGIEPNKIETMLPCTPFQREVMDRARGDKRRAIGHAVFEIGQDVDVQRLAAAWKEVTRQKPALRSRIFTSTNGDHYQVVLLEDFTWLQSSRLDGKEVVIKDEAAAATREKQCNRYALLGNPRTKKQRLLLWTFSHAVVDNSLQETVLRKVLSVYKGEITQNADTVVGVRADGFANASKDVALFWQRHFDNLDASSFPVLPSHLTRPQPGAQAEHKITYPASTQRHWDHTAVCRAALAVLLTRYTHASEALFGVAVERPPYGEGQERQVHGLTRTVMPTRVFCDPHQPASDLLRAVAAHDAAVREFEQAGLDSVRHAGTLDPPRVISKPCWRSLLLSAAVTMPRPGQVPCFIGLS